MQQPEIARFLNHVEATSRQSAWAKRKMLVKSLLAEKYSSINELVRSVDGNTRDKAWVSQAFKDGHIVRSAEGFFGLSDQEPMTEDETELERVYRAILEMNDGPMSDALDKACRAAQARVEESRRCEI